jgi:hypothetical protein
MEVRRYRPADYTQIARWAYERDKTEYAEHQFPATGFIVDGVAAFFLYKTDSSVCFCENMIANKNSDKKTRDLAIDLIIEAIFKEAKEQGFRVAYATTGLPAAVYRAVQHGAQAIGKQVLLTKNLNDPSV